MAAGNGDHVYMKAGDILGFPAIPENDDNSVTAEDEDAGYILRFGQDHGKRLAMFP